MPTNLQAIQSKQLQVQSLVESIARDRDRKLVLERLYREALAEPAPAPVVVQPPPVRPDASPTGTIPQQLAAARAELAGLETRYTANHPDVSRARRKVADLEAKAAAESPAPPAPPTAVASATPATSAPMDPARRERLREMAAEIESLDRQTEFKEREEARVRAEIAEYQSRVEAVPGLEVSLYSLNDIVQPAPGDERVDEPIAATVDQLTVTVAETPQVIAVVSPGEVVTRGFAGNLPRAIRVADRRHGVDHREQAIGRTGRPLQPGPYTREVGERAGDDERVEEERRQIAGGQIAVDQRPATQPDHRGDTGVQTRRLVSR